MSIRLFICTYRNPTALDRNLASLFASDLTRHEHEICVINNCQSEFRVRRAFRRKVKVLHNVCRPDFSWGHLSRSWNQGLMLGFENLAAPACPHVMLAQDDTLFAPDFCSRVLEAHARFDLITADWGDMFLSFTPEAVRRVGIFDERFCQVGYQEGDYFLRALMCHRERVSINDRKHGRVLNTVGFPICRRPHRRANPHSAPQRTCLSKQVFQQKWPGIRDTHWTNDLVNNPPESPAIPTYLTYPYFEKDLYDLRGKGYVCDFSDPRPHM
jgi:hypothetical protein